jgi:hypothetical protein
VSGWCELVRPFTVSPTGDRVRACASRIIIPRIAAVVAHDQLAELILERVRERLCKPDSAADVEPVAIRAAAESIGKLQISWLLISGNSAGLSTSVDRGHEAQGGTAA